MTIREEVLQYWKDVYNSADKARLEALAEAQRQTFIMFKAEKKMKETLKTKFYGEE